MRVPWTESRCIVCLDTAPLTEEHVIPRALGGKLTCCFLCKPCNDRLGIGIEAGAKADPSIRLAALALRPEAPSVTALVEDGQHYVLESGPAKLRAKLVGGELRGRSIGLEDGSLMQPMDLARATVERMLVKDGHGPDYVAQAMVRFDAAPEGVKVELAPDLKIINWPIKSAQPDLSKAELVDELLLVKIAFEFFALMVEGVIYENAPQLDELRHALSVGEYSEEAFSVERFMADSRAPINGICYEGSDPHARFQVRLFGKRAYRVQFHKIASAAPRTVYTHNLAAGWEDVREIPC